MPLRRINSQLIIIAIFHLILFPSFLSSYKQIRAFYQCECFTHIKKESPGPDFSWSQQGRAGIHRINIIATCLTVTWLPITTTESLASWNGGDCYWEESMNPTFLFA